ncbi:flagellin [Sulfurimonas sp.]|uniref:flagellin N-terminal helical domain-containing protein n=1 Tax=Sulfurimonas sp. TaxID=2022749 RepID=UPI00356757B1
MGFRINSNIGAMNASLHSNLSNMGMNKSLGSLASGSAINYAAYDASGLGIANQLSAQVSGLGRAIMNSNESIGMLQVADGALQEYGDTLERVRTLTLQASNGTLGASDRAIIQKEIDSLMESADNIAKSTTFNDINLLDGSGGSAGNGTFITHTGANTDENQSVTIGDAQTASLLSGAIDVTTQAGASASLSTIDDAMKSIDGMRADLGAAQNQLMSNIRNISVTQINVASAESQIRDIDFAAESANFSKMNILSQTGSFAQAQSNAAQANVLNLFK